jgi:DNA polymerase-3 subunit delta
MDALAFLEKSAKAKRQPIYVLVGDEDLLKRRCREAIVKLAIGDGDPEFAIASYSGDKIDLSAVRNDLETLPFFCAARVVMIEQADQFVTDNREGLERYFAAPSSIGILVLEVKSFAETTKLAKALPDGAKLSCKAPPANKLGGWCIQWAKATHQKILGEVAAGLLLELVGPQMGLLAKEIEKLAVSVGEKPEIKPEDVDQYIRRSSNAFVFDIVNAIGDARPGDALKILMQLFEEGDNPLAVLGALTSQLRKLANIGRLLSQGHSEGSAMDAAGIPKWPQARQSAAKQVRHLGRRRLAQLPDWLVEINVGMKGENPLPNELQLERLIVKLARPRVAATS